MDNGPKLPRTGEPKVDKLLDYFCRVPKGQAVITEAEARRAFKRKGTKEADPRTLEARARDWAEECNLTISAQKFGGFVIKKKRAPNGAN